MADFDKETVALTSELYAAEVAYCLGQIAKAQHRISIALCSVHRASVVKHLRELGISEAAASTFVTEPLSSEDIMKIVILLETIQGWRPHLAQKSGN